MAELTFNETMDPHTVRIAPAGAAVHIAISPDRHGTIQFDAYYTPHEAGRLEEAIPDEAGQAAGGSDPNADP